MEDFLTFLSNNYLYFLVAAGVLFFALIGFLVDLKKKNNVASNVEEEVPNIPVPDTTSQVSSVEPQVTTEPVQNVEQPSFEDSYSSNTTVNNEMAQTQVPSFEEEQINNYEQPVSVSPNVSQNIQSTTPVEEEKF